MTDFLDDVLADGSRPGTRCSIGTLLGRLDDTDTALATSLRAALDHPSARHSAISRKLRDVGYEIAETTIARHRGGKCKCDR